LSIAGPGRGSDSDGSAVSKAEDFVPGDVCVKLVRGLEKVAVLVIKSQ
jgi:hypothetical protein